MDYKTVGKRIALIRKGKGITQEQLAEKLDVSINTIYNIEKGVTGISLSTAVRIVNLLGCTVDSLLDGFLWHHDRSIPSEAEQMLMDCCESERQFLLLLLSAIKSEYKKWNAK